MQKTLILSGQSLHAPVVNTRDNETLGESSIAIFRKGSLKMEYLVVNVSGEETSQLLVRFKEIESANSYCVLVSLDDNLPDNQAPLSPNDYIQLIGEDICVRPGTIGQIDKVIVDAETGDLISVTVGEEILSAEQFFTIYNLTGSDDTELGRAEMILNKQQQQIEAWMETLSQQMSTMTDSMLRMEKCLSQKLEQPATGADCISVRPTELSEVNDQVMSKVHPHSTETPDHVSSQFHMPLTSETEQDMERTNEQSAFNANLQMENPLASATKQDEHQSVLETLLLGKLDHIEQTLDVLVSRESLHDTAIPTEQKKIISDTPFPEFEADDKNENVTLIKQAKEEDMTGFHTESYSLKQPGTISEEEKPIKDLLLDSIIAELKTARLDQPENKTDPQTVLSPDPVKTADTAAKSRSEMHQVHTTQQKVKRSTSAFWKNSGSQVLGMSLFVMVYCMLTFFQIL
jgi:hypothetical protein